MLDNYLGLLNARDNYEILLNRYNVAVKRNDKEQLNKIAGRVGVSIPDRIEYDAPELKDIKDKTAREFSNSDGKGFGKEDSIKTKE